MWIDGHSAFGTNAAPYTAFMRDDQQYSLRFLPWNLLPVFSLKDMPPVFGMLELIIAGWCILFFVSHRVYFIQWIVCFINLVWKCANDICHIAVQYSSAFAHICICCFFTVSLSLKLKLTTPQRHETHPQLLFKHNLKCKSWRRSKSQGVHQLMNTTIVQVTFGIDYFDIAGGKPIYIANRCEQD